MTSTDSGSKGPGKRAVSYYCHVRGSALIIILVPWCQKRYNVLRGRIWLPFSERRIPVAFSLPRENFFLLLFSNVSCTLEAAEAENYFILSSTERRALLLGSFFYNFARGEEWLLISSSELGGHTKRSLLPRRRRFFLPLRLCADVNKKRGSRFSEGFPRKRRTEGRSVANQKDNKSRTCHTKELMMMAFCLRISNTGPSRLVVFLPFSGLFFL